MRIPSNKLSSILNFAKTELTQIYEDREIQSFFYLLCEYYLGLNKTAVILNRDYAVSESEFLKFSSAIKDLKLEKPIQYIIEKTEFFGLEFKVNKHTLIPRPETEELVQWIIEREQAEKELNILDIGTGSGCIAISLSKKLKNANVLGVDISLEALQIAQFNNKNLEANVEFEILDILNPPKNFVTKFDVIVSNPPYVLESEKLVIKKNVLDYEPEQALFVKDKDPLLFYRKILDFADYNSVKGGRIYFEINERMSDELIILLNHKKYHSLELKNDIHERQRMIRAEK